MRHILLLGGTGAIGRYIVNEYNQAPDAMCYVTTRQKDKYDTEQVKYIIGNAHELNFLRKVLSLKKWDVIVDFMKYSTEEFKEKSVLFLVSTNQYIYMSSCRVYAEGSGILTENSPRLLDCCTDKDYLRTDEYALAKARQENILQNSDKRNWTIIRPYVTFSDERLQLSPMEKEYWLYRVLKGRKIVTSKDLMDKVTTFTYGLDVARGIMSVMNKKNALGEVFQITSPFNYKWGDFLNVYTQTIEGVTGKHIHVCYTNQWKECMGGVRPQVVYDRLYNRIFDNHKISQFIDIETFHEPKKALRECVIRFLNKPRFGHIDWDKETGKDIISGDWSTICELENLHERLRYIKKHLKYGFSLFCRA